MIKIQNDIKYSLIGKKLSGQISNADDESLSRWVNSSTEAKKYFEELKSHGGNIQFSCDIHKLGSLKDIR